MDKFSKEVRSRIMSKIRYRDTSIEIAVRKWLEESGIEFEDHPKMKGKPDFKAGNVLIFVDGCFWHMCPIHYKRPKTNTEYWIKNIEEKNKKMRKVREELKSQGYKIVEIWEHEVRDGSFVKKLEKIKKAFEGVLK